MHWRPQNTTHSLLSGRPPNRSCNHLSGRLPSRWSCSPAWFDLRLFVDGLRVLVREPPSNVLGGDMELLLDPVFGHLFSRSLLVPAYACVGRPARGSGRRASKKMGTPKTPRNGGGPWPGVWA